MTNASIDEVARQYRQESPGGDPRSWRIERANILDVFDGSAPVDRARLARLYGGRSPRVARGPIVREGRVVTVVLLLSPYPEVDLKTLNPGTLVMEVRSFAKWPRL